MTVKGGPKIVDDGLVFNLDAAGALSDKGYDPEGLRVEYLVVGGGGGGGGWSTAGGGGAGGFLTDVIKLSSGTYVVTVGAGGTRGDNGSSRKGSNGGNSQFGASLIAYGGGGGGANTGDFNGLNGGSGGGGFQGNGATGIGGSGVTGQGNNGGNGGGSWRSGSGGGAGASGTPGVGGYSSAPGGIGKISRIDFNREYYAGGGASGGCGGGNRSGGFGGGGNGGSLNSDGTNGQTNRGGGGGGGGCYYTRATFGGNGGSGIVMIRYRGKQKATGGDSIVYKNGYTVHTFTSSGSFVLDETVDGLSTSKIVGTLNNMGSSNYSSGNRGYFTFDGSNEYIQTPAINLNYNAITISAWIYKSSNATANGEAIISKSVLGKREFHFRIEDSPQNGIYFWKSSNGSGADYLFDTNIPISLNQWQNVVVTMNTTNVEFYLNGNNIKSYSGSYTMYNGDAPMFIGKWAEDNNWMFSGRIASVSIHNYVLSANEVEQNYNATKGRFGL